MAIGGKPAAKAMKTKGVKGKDLKNSDASRKTKAAFTKMGAKRKK